jgi:hypothetical protein
MRRRPWDLVGRLWAAIWMGLFVLILAVMMLAWLITDTSMRVWPDVVQQGEPQ